MIDDEEFAGPLCRLKFQPELFLDGGEDGWPGGVVRGHDRVICHVATRE